VNNAKMLMLIFRQSVYLTMRKHLVIFWIWLI